MKWSEYLKEIKERREKARDDAWPGHAWTLVEDDIPRLIARIERQTALIRGELGVDTSEEEVPDG